MVTATYSSPLGTFQIVVEGEELKELLLEGCQDFHTGETDDGNPVIVAVKQWLNSYFAGEKVAIGDLKLRPEGTAFRKLVWQLLCEIPYGETVTYGDIAKKAATLLGKEHMSAQAVGGAVGANPIPVIIPCHRVVGANKALTGFGLGMDRKIRLLSIEGIDVSEYTM